MRFLLCITFAIWSQATVHAEELRILTSFPSEMTDVFQELWQDRHPQTELLILNKNTVSAVEEIQRGNTREFDIFWASSPEAFVLLQRDNHFADDATCVTHGVAPVEEFAISSVGWARRSDSDLFMPGAWNDLLLPIYSDQIAMTRPARSGTTHLLVEQILQLRGWDEGWAYLLELSGNLSTLTARSHGVPEGLLNERFEIGLMIDFLATSRGEALQFQYGRPLMIFGASIGILNGGENQIAACDFSQLLLSRDGQLALVDPRVSRIPIDADVRMDVSTAIPAEIITGLRLPWLDYNPDISANRYWAVNALFDLMITDVLIERRRLWRRHVALQERAAPDDLARIKHLLTAVPVSELQAIEISSRSDTGLRPSVQPVPGSSEREALDQWRASVADLLVEAAAALNQVERDIAE